jgi:hypothetical protein
MQNSKITEQDIKALQELKDKVGIRAMAEKIVHSYGYHEGEVIDYDYAVDMVAEALSK